jgi:O-antigen ligase
MEALIATLLIIIPLWKVCRRAGFHPAISLIAIIPLLGLLIVAGILAFADWPALKRPLSTQEG